MTVKFHSTVAKEMKQNVGKFRGPVQSFGEVVGRGEKEFTTPSQSSIVNRFNIVLINLFNESYKVNHYYLTY